MSTTTMTMPAIGPGSAGILMTPEEFDAITEYDELYRYELIRGVLVVSPIPSEKEADPNEVLGGLLFVYREQHAQGAALDLTLQERYVRTAESRRRGDRVIWAGLGRRPHPKEDVPTIVVEFVSPGKRSWRRDYIENRREYRELGVLEYWIFDRFARILTVDRATPAGPLEIVVAEGQTYQTPLLPGVELSVARLLSASDAWRDQE